MPLFSNRHGRVVRREGTSKRKLYDALVANHLAMPASRVAGFTSR